MRHAQKKKKLWKIYSGKLLGSQASNLVEIHYTPSSLQLLNFASESLRGLTLTHFLPLEETRWNLLKILW